MRVLSTLNKKLLEYKTGTDTAHIELARLLRTLRRSAIYCGQLFIRPVGRNHPT